jgi:hypothetical protein
VGEQDAQPVTAEKENKNMNFKSNNRNSNSVAPHSTNAAQSSNRQQTTTQQIIAENVKHLIEQLEQGKSEALTAYLTAMAHFHSYSFGNILSIAHHRPDATHVAGIRTWNELGRFVMKGQKGIPILAPMIGTKRQREEKPVDQFVAQSDKPSPVLIGFRTVYVFDIAQTEGAELPQHATVSGEVGAHHERLIDFVQQQAIELEYNERIAPAQGASYGGKIVLLPGQTKAEEFSTLVHELAHEMLHRTERRTITTKTVRETEAESIAFIVGRAVGLDTGTASSDYVAMYGGNVELLTESLAVIQQASATILDALFAEVAEPLAQAS